MNIDITLLIQTSRGTGCLWVACWDPPEISRISSLQATHPCQPPKDPPRPPQGTTRDLPRSSKDFPRLPRGRPITPSESQSGPWTNHFERLQKKKVQEPQRRLQRRALAHLKRPSETLGVAKGCPGTTHFERLPKRVVQGIPKDLSTTSSVPPEAPSHPLRATKSSQGTTHFEFLSK